VSTSTKWLLAISLALGGLAALVVWLAPDERTLGSGIKVVYVHVALTWVGMSAMAVAGLIGLVGLASSRATWLDWAQSIGWVGAGFFAGGLAMSLVAARVNWGGVFLAEPRAVASLAWLALGVIAFGGAGWLGRSRWAGALYALPLAAMAWSAGRTPMVLHPQSAIWSSPSVGIRLTFVLLFLLGSIAAATIAVHWKLNRSVSAIANRSANTGL
jgi:hypothetical protein